jgi:EAL domain-containing protein (putative c-di-GMP-specific phosphodiesterase class I)
MLDDETLSTRILRMLSDRKLEPSCLILELTETALVSSPIQTRNTLRAMSEAGIRISIDDFGSGYTSFKQLRELEISEIKIDGMYVANITEQGRDASIVRSIVELGRGFDIHVIAECVEREKSWQLLQVLGCRSAQGYSIGKPMPREEFDQWMDGWAASNAPLLEHGAGVVRAEVLPLPDEWRA